VASSAPARAQRRSFRPVLQAGTVAGGGVGALGASITGHGGLAACTLAVAALAVIGELWIAKRRDDLLRRVATRPKTDPVVLRELSVYEAVRTGLLSSQDAAALLGSRPGGSSPARPDST
jgi:hypothetical protein